MRFQNLIVVLAVLCIPQFAFAAPQKWGGQGVEITVTGKTAELRFNCASGRTDAWVVKRGKVSAVGTFTPELGLPFPPTPAPKPVPATYIATINGNSMTFQHRNESGQISPRFTLKKGAQSELANCM